MKKFVRSLLHIAWLIAYIAALAYLMVLTRYLALTLHTDPIYRHLPENTRILKWIGTDCFYTTSRAVLASLLLYGYARTWLVRFVIVILGIAISVAFKSLIEFVIDAAGLLSYFGNRSVSEMTLSACIETITIISAFAIAARLGIQFQRQNRFGTPNSNSQSSAAAPRVTAETPG